MLQKLRNTWANYKNIWIFKAFTHIKREGNMCTDRLVNHDHVILDIQWWNSLPHFIKEELYKDKLELPNYCFG